MWPRKMGVEGRKRRNERLAKARFKNLRSFVARVEEIGEGSFLLSEKKKLLHSEIHSTGPLKGENNYRARWSRGGNFESNDLVIVSLGEPKDLR